MHKKQQLWIHDFLRNYYIFSLKNGTLLNLPIAIKISLTFIAVLAEVSMKSKLLSSAYACASYRNKLYMGVMGNLASYIYIFKNFIKDVQASNSKTPGLPENLRLFCWPSLLCSLPVQ